MEICVIGISCRPPQFLTKLSDTFSARITFSEMLLPKEAHDSERQQWSAEKIINDLKKKDSKADKVLGVTDVDIAVRSLNYVFGLSEIGGRNSLISLFRLHPESYGKSDGKVFEKRALKEATHELGHSFGLQHCRDRKCVMSFSNSIEDVDKKEGRFCTSCTKHLSLL